MERKADEETAPTEKQLRTGGDMPPRGRTVLQVRFPKKGLDKAALISNNDLSCV